MHSEHTQNSTLALSAVSCFTCFWEKNGAIIIDRVA